VEAENVIIGSGPAGLAAAAFAREPALVLEGRESPGWKILISGDGHCNVSNTFAPEEFLRRMGSGGRQLKYALGAFGPDEVRAWFANRGCPTVVRDEWEVFPKSNRAEDILETLLAAAEKNGSEVLCGGRVTGIARASGSGFIVHARSEEIRCRRLVIAAGTPAWGRPQPQFEDALRRLGHTVRPFVPGVCAVALEGNPFEGLAGLSFKGRVSVAGKWKDADEILITDDGLSGPGVMNPSAGIYRRLYDGEGGEFEVDFLPGPGAAETVKMFLALRQSAPRAFMRTALGEVMPKRLAARLAEIAGVADVTASQLTKPEAGRLAACVHHFKCNVVEMPSLAKAFVASGGMPLEEVNMRTMESRIVRGLYFAGEILDYDAPGGGFNITLALATGRLAGLQLAAEK